MPVWSGRGRRFRRPAVGYDATMSSRSVVEELLREHGRTWMRDATWQERVDALGRGGYRRYDKSTSTKLEQLSQQVLEEHGGDLRRIRPGGPHPADDLARTIATFPRIGPTGPRTAWVLRATRAGWPSWRRRDRSLASRQPWCAPVREADGQLVGAQPTRNRESTGPTTLGLIMCVCPGTVSSRPFGTAAAIAACALRMYSGLLPPATTSVCGSTRS